jgi:hypothetical protein
MLPRELWVEILKIKWWNARVRRLEKILKYPKRIEYYPFPVYDSEEEEEESLLYTYFFRLSEIIWIYYNGEEQMETHNIIDIIYYKGPGYELTAFHEVWETKKKRRFLEF